MLSEKAKLQLQMFLTTFEKETGFSPSHIDFWAHQEDNNEEDAKIFADKFKAEINHFGGHSSAKKTDITLDHGTDYSVYYMYAPIEHEPEKEPERCHRCGNEFTEEEMCSPFIEETCAPCHNEMAAEKQHEKSEYLRSVL